MSGEPYFPPEGGRLVAPPPGFGGTLFRIKRNCQLGTVTVPSAGTGYAGAVQLFSLGLLPNVTELTFLFDQYRIAYVVWRLTCRPSVTSVVESAVNNSLGLPRLIIARDYDSTTAPASSSSGWDDLQQYSTAHRFDFGNREQRTFEMGVKPAVAVPIYRTSLSTFGYGPKWDQWLDCQYTDITYQGLRYVVNVPYTTSLSDSVTFDVDATFYVEMRTTR